MISHLRQIHLLIFFLFSSTMVNADLPEVVTDISPAVVSLSVTTAGGDAYSGTGFFVDGSGVIATNYHVIEGGRRITAKTHSGVTLFCKGVLTMDEKRDLVLLKFAGSGFKSLSLADSEKIQRGESVAVIGSPLGLEQTVSSGIVSAKRVSNGWEQIQVTAPISKGSSGSPVVNMKGEVVGVATFMRLNGQALNFASSVKHLSPMVNSLEQLEPVTLADALPARRKKPIEEPKVNPRKVVETQNKEDFKTVLMREFWDSYWSATKGNSANDWASHFTNSTDYQYKKKGRATRDEIAEGAKELHRKYPRRKYTLKDSPELIPLNEELTRVGFDFSYSYRYSGAGKSASGIAYVELALQLTSNGWKIYKFRELVKRRK